MQLELQNLEVLARYVVSLRHCKCNFGYYVDFHVVRCSKNSASTLVNFFKFLGENSEAVVGHRCMIGALTWSTGHTQMHWHGALTALACPKWAKIS